MQLLINATSPFGRIARIAMIEKGLDVAPTWVDPWADDARLRAANAASRVPTLVTDDGTPISESLAIVLWLEATRPTPPHPGLLGADPTGVLSRTGIAIGVVEAAVHTLVGRKIAAPAGFDDTPIGLRRRRTIAEGLQRLDQHAAEHPPYRGEGTPLLDSIATVVARDYVRFRFPAAPWMPRLPALDRLAKLLRARDSFERTAPH